MNNSEIVSIIEKAAEEVSTEKKVVCSFEYMLDFGDCAVKVDFSRN